MASELEREDAKLRLLGNLATLGRKEIEAMERQVLAPLIEGTWRTRLYGTEKVRLRIFDQGLLVTFNA